MAGAIRYFRLKDSSQRFTALIIHLTTLSKHGDRFGGLSMRTFTTRHSRSADHRLVGSGRYTAAIIGLSAITALALWSPCFAVAWGTDDQTIADDIVEMLAIKRGSTVAEIGAGNGAMAVRIAKKIGPNGRVFATEIDPTLVKKIRERARKAGVNNVTAVTATTADTGLPADCCDGAYMLGVYHHITEPVPTDASIFRALKPGARLLINDFPPTIWLALFKVKGVPANRGGHGVRDQIVINEMTAAGFREVKEARPWHPGFFIRDNYCIELSKPGDSGTAPQK
jgi:SAM-dependent methyltransferase